jgi:hypothetical protein
MIHPAALQQRPVRSGTGVGGGLGRRFWWPVRICGREWKGLNPTTGIALGAGRVVFGKI